eukprot:TRINITY_DN18708_c0_g2_i1.p1 TRINITY_DN18708_c0_g2~~TRINITY_DN18708_c0_g2_i1.p1  ORF type:complete len:174 (+),score=24.70 TRINITY_DN18708_c0_g2_i1:322-843(+)
MWTYADATSSSTWKANVPVFKDIATRTWRLSDFHMFFGCLGLGRRSASLPLGCLSYMLPISDAVAARREVSTWSDKYVTQIWKNFYPRGGVKGAKLEESSHIELRSTYSKSKIVVDHLARRCKSLRAVVDKALDRIELIVNSAKALGFGVEDHVSRLGVLRMEFCRFSVRTIQ